MPFQREKERFSDYTTMDFDIIKSEKKAFRNRAEFRIWWEKDENANEILSYASKKNVSVLIDAEDFMYQQRIDEILLDFMKKYHHEKPIVFTTLQMYRNDRLDYLEFLIEMANRENFMLGIKFVRGAYMEKERARAQAEGYPSPIQPNKEASDRDYNLALEFITTHHERFGLFAGSHNEESCEFLIKLMNENGIEKSNPNFWFEIGRAHV